MKDLTLNGIKVRVTKYKVVIYDEKGNLSSEQAALIGAYVYDEGFIEKDEFPVEVIVL